jgi:dTDP-4-dehydrorhamnose 3,5-epimerase
LTPTPLEGVVLVEVDRLEDERGFFARTFDRAAFAAAGLEPAVEQCSVAHNLRAGTVRGMHWAAPDVPEHKLVRCTAGAVHDVVVDLRDGSPTRLQSFAVELSADGHRALYVPPGVAHGYQTLLDGTELTYQMSTAYRPGQDRGACFDDPALGLSWPLPVSVVSAKDQGWPAYGTSA